MTLLILSLICFYVAGVFTCHAAWAFANQMWLDYNYRISAAFAFVFLVIAVALVAASTP